MSTLTGRAPKDTYGDLLQVSNANDGVDSTLRFVSDGKGTNSSFKISSSSAQFTGTLTSTGLLTTTAGIVSGSDIISDTDSTDDLGSTGVRWANLWVDNITMGGTIAGAVATFSSTLTVTGLTTATGGITSGGDILSDTDSTDSLGSTGVRWLKGWFDTLTAGTLTIGGGTITDSSGAISFGNENLTTTGNVDANGVEFDSLSGTGAVAITD
ncbi:MAG: hypothetical protein HOE45_08960, partial [Gammaproteobacteria bacterium]|nr:hypothetical protein [Gammaproteobacteria bacterium]